MNIMLANPDDVFYLGRVSKPTNYDGKPGTAYFLKLDGSIDCGSIKCTEEAFIMAENIDLRSKVNIVGDYSSDYRSFRVTGIKQVK